MSPRDRDLVLLVVLALVLALLALCWRDHGTEHDVHVGTSPAGPSLDLGRVEAMSAVTSTTTTSSTTTTTSPPKVSHPRRTIPAAATGSVPDMIRAGFARFGPDVAEQAVRVSGCETGHTYNPGATNGQHAGLFQLSRTYQAGRASKLGYSWSQMFEAGPNIAVAVDLYAEQGWQPWTCRYAA